MEKGDKIVAIVSLVATALIAIAASISTVVVSKTQFAQTTLSVSARSAISMLNDQALKSEPFFVAIDQVDRLVESSQSIQGIDVEKLRIIARNANDEISRLRPHMSAELAEISGDLGLDVDKLLDYSPGSEKFKAVVFDLYKKKLQFRDAYYKERAGLRCIAFPSKGNDCEDIKPLIELIKPDSTNGGASQPEQSMWP